MLRIDAWPASSSGQTPLVATLSVNSSSIVGTRTRAASWTASLTHPFLWAAHVPLGGPEPEASRLHLVRGQDLERFGGRRGRWAGSRPTAPSRGAKDRMVVRIQTDRAPRPQNHEFALRRALEAHQQQYPN